MTSIFDAHNHPAAETNVGGWGSRYVAELLRRRVGVFSDTHTPTEVQRQNNVDLPKWRHITLGKAKSTKTSAAKE
jgi:hypothetical protein